MESEQKHAAFDEFIRCSFYLHQSPHKCSLSNTYSLHCSRRLPQFEIHHFVIFIPQSHRHLSNFIAYQINWQNKQGPQRTEQLHPFAHFPTSIRKSLGRSETPSLRYSLSSGRSPSGKLCLRCCQHWWNNDFIWKYVFYLFLVTYIFIYYYYFYRKTAVKSSVSFSFLVATIRLDFGVYTSYMFCK